MRAQSTAFLSLLFVFIAVVGAFPSFPARLHAIPVPQRSQLLRPFYSIIEKIWPSPVSCVKSSGTSRGAGIGRKLPGYVPSRYRGDMLVRFNITTHEEASALAEAADVLFLDVWEFTEDWVDIRLGNETMPALLSMLPLSLQTSYTPLMNESALSEAISHSFPEPSAEQSPHDAKPQRSSFTPSLRTPQSPSTTNVFFQDYQPLSVIVPWMSLLSSMFPTHTRMIDIGYSFEGRSILALRVGVHPTNRESPASPRQTIVVVGGSHAREWISTTSVNFLAYHFITSYGKIPVVTSLLQAFDWVFIPTINPDGYVYTWESDRLWRKNRQATPLRFCRGLDLDRSWDFEWDGNATRENPCSESYAGGAAFEGVEAARLAAWARNETEKNGVEIVSFIDLHSYSQQVLYPYSFSCLEAPPTLENLQELALGLAKAMRLASGGRFYRTASACEGNVGLAEEKEKEKEEEGAGKRSSPVLPRMESGGGSAIDWFYHELKVKYAYQIKLRDTGSYGFLLPKENIVPTGEEVVDAMVYMGEYLMGEVGFQVDEVELRKGEELPPAPVVQQRLGESGKEVEDGLGFGLDEAEVDGDGRPGVGDEEVEEIVIQSELKRRRRR